MFKNSVIVVLVVAIAVLLWQNSQAPELPVDPPIKKKINVPDDKPKEIIHVDDMNDDKEDVPKSIIKDVIVPPEKVIERDVFAVSLTSAEKIALIEKIRQHTVVVYVTNDRGAGWKGSGVAIQRFGDYVLVVTNAHVVVDVEQAGNDKAFYMRAKNLMVELISGKQMKAYLFKSYFNIEQERDLSFLIVPDADRIITVSPIVAEAGNLKKGDAVFAVGNPLDEKFFVDDGVILDYTSERGGLILHDATIEHGSSGGGLFDIEGNLIGINTWGVGETYGKAQEIQGFLHYFKVESFTVSARVSGWQPSNIFLRKGGRAAILAVGTWSMKPEFEASSAQGWSNYSAKLYSEFDGGALLANVQGNSQISITAQAWSLSSRHEVYVNKADSRSGSIFARDADGLIDFAINDSYTDDNDGELTVFVLKPWDEFEWGNYTGDLSDGIPWGKGKIIFENGESYEGDWINGRPHGTGTWVYKTNDIGMRVARVHEGQWIEGNVFGYGKVTLEHDGSVIEGNWMGPRTLQNDIGKRTFTNGDVYEGTIYELGILGLSGRGKFTRNDGRIYDGQWTSGYMSGQGTMTWPGGIKYIGAWESSQMSGQGTMTWPSGYVYVGEWAKGKHNGQGKKSEIISGPPPENEPLELNYYEGQWKDGKYHGYGSYWLLNGGTYEGSWENGEKHGNGTFTDRDGNVSTQTWQHGKQTK